MGPPLSRFHDLVESAELDPLLREVDALCERRDFDGLLRLREMCNWAVDRGKQVWPIAEHIVYRLVLEGPAEIAGPLVVPGTGRFAPGPLTEVAASTHAFAEIVEHLHSPQARETVAAERVIRGEDLSQDKRAHPSAVEIPLRLVDFEPAYRLARYRKDHVEVEEPAVPSPSEGGLASSGHVVSDDDLEGSLLDLVRPWFEESGGTAEAVVVEGEATHAIGALVPDEVATHPIDLKQALELMAWAASSGGAFGRRRGAAYGRFSAWWALAQMCDLPWPVEIDELQHAGEELTWLIFRRTNDKSSGWHLGLACSSKFDGWACAIHARDDSANDDTPQDPGAAS